MNIRRKRDFLKTQILEVQRLMGTVADHPLMSDAFKKRESDFKVQLDKIPVDMKEAKVTLMFFGKPVKGSLGIDASFVGKVVVPFQNMVKSDFAHRVHGKVGERGRINSEEDSRLFVTALPRGSFGIELSQLGEGLFDDDQIADSLSHVAKLVEASARSDEDFAAQLDEVAPRTVQLLNDFLKVIADDQAGVAIESGGIRCSLEPLQAKGAFDRVASTETKDETIDFLGVFKGILLESWRYDFLNEQNETITGKIDENVSDERATRFLTEFVNKRCIATLQVSRAIFKNGRERTSYTLLDLKPTDS
jgi:hypothetical protein